MIKGVNKQILEVTNTENPYFEKIIFFVKPEFKNEDTKKLQKEAESLALSAQKPPRIKMSKRQLLKMLASAALFTLAGCALTFLINMLLR